MADLGDLAKCFGPYLESIWAIWLSVWGHISACFWLSVFGQVFGPYFCVFSGQVFA